MRYEVGEHLKVTITGAVKSGTDRAHRSCHLIEDEHGNSHYVFLDGGEHAGLKIEPCELYEAGQVYCDDDGDLFFRNPDNDGWIGPDGSSYSDSFACRL